MLTRNCTRRPRSQGRHRRPVLESLEGRVVLSTLTVLNNADSGPGSLRAEIAAASGGDTIAFSRKLESQTIILTTGELVVNKDLTIKGFNDQGVTISGNGAGPRS